MNRRILESDCRKCKFDEMRLAEEQIDRVPGTVGISQTLLVVMDRGYPSTAAFIRMMEKGILFLARLKSSDYKKEQTSLSTPDTWVDIHLDKSGTRHYKGTDMGQRMEEPGKLARAMITHYGISKGFDMVAMETVSNQYLGGDTFLLCSAETQAEIERQVVELVKMQHEEATGILMENRERLDELARFLYEKETITGEEFMAILNA